MTLTDLYTTFSVVGILLFASMVYICESELVEEVPRFYKNTTIFVKLNTTWTFPECFWWGLMTITTGTLRDGVRDYLLTAFGPTIDYQWRPKENIC